jgi:hypothetical protein
LNLETPAIRRRLIAAIRLACSERVVPKLEFANLDPIELDSCLRVLRPLWDGVSAAGRLQELHLITSAFIWPRGEVLRYGYFRLLAVAVNETEAEGAATWAAIEIAAEPVPKGSNQPPGKFDAFARTDILLVSEVLEFLVSMSEREELTEVPRRVAVRARSNWRRIAAAVW